MYFHNVWCSKVPCWCWHFSTTKADVTWKKNIIQMVEKYRVVDKNLRERQKLGNAYISELHYKKDDIEFASKLQNKFL